jgi:hypothetical protein
MVCAGDEHLHDAMIPAIGYEEGGRVRGGASTATGTATSTTGSYWRNRETYSAVGTMDVQLTLLTAVRAVGSGKCSNIFPLHVEYEHTVSRVVSECNKITIGVRCDGESTRELHWHRNVNRLHSLQ